MLCPCFLPSSNEFMKMACTARRCSSFVLSKIVLWTKMPWRSCMQKLQKRSNPSALQPLELGVSLHIGSKAESVIERLCRPDPLQHCLSRRPNIRTVVVWVHVPTSFRSLNVTIGELHRLGTRTETSTCYPGIFAIKTRPSTARPSFSTIPN